MDRLESSFMAAGQGHASPTPSVAPLPTRIDDRLDSWKEIAAYLRRGVRTVKRWEKDEGLPVHRHLHRRLGTVYAHKPEIDRWWTTRGLELRSEDPEPRHAVEVARARGRLLAGSAVLSVAVVVVAGYLTWRQGSTASPQPARVKLAVLPFENLSGDPDQEFFSDGLTEDMITELGRFRPDRIGVIARTTSMIYKRTTKSAAQIGAELHVDYLLEGSVRREGERIRVSAQLVRTNDQTHLWADQYDRELGGILDVQSQVVPRDRRPDPDQARPRATRASRSSGQRVGPRSRTARTLPAGASHGG